MSTTAIIVSASAFGALFLIWVVYLLRKFSRFCEEQLRYGGVDREEWILTRLKTARTTPHYAYIEHGDYDKCDRCHIMIATKKKMDEELCVQCYRI